MKEKIQKLAAGVRDLRERHLVFSAERIEVVLGKEEAGSAEFSFHAEDYSLLRGLTVSTSARVKVDPKTFSSSRVSMKLLADLSGVPEGESIEGELLLLMNVGEFRIPYVFRKERSTNEIDNALSNLEGMMDLYYSDRRELLRLISAPEFRSSRMLRRELLLLGAFETFFDERNPKRSLEEFLVYFKRKNQAQFRLIPSPEELRGDEEKISLGILTENPGYLRLRVLHEKDSFLVPERDSIDTDEFREGRGEINFSIQPEFLHGGWNETEIELTDGQRSVKKSYRLYKRAKKKRFMKQADPAFLRILRNTAVFLGSAGEKQDELGESLRALLMELKSNPAYETFTDLLEFALLLHRKTQTGAKALYQVLKVPMLRKQKEDTLAYTWFLFLSYRLTKSRDLLGQLTTKVSALYEEDPSDPWRTLLFVLWLEELHTDRSEMLTIMRRSFDAGCRSPLIFAQALSYYRESPRLFRPSGVFDELVLMEGVKNGILPDVLAEIYCKTAPPEETYLPYHAHLYRAMMKGNLRDYALNRLVGLLIRSGRRDKHFFRYFEEAVQKEMMINGLFESYIEALPPGFDKPLSENLLLYFSLSGRRSEEERELLYGNILRYYKEDSRVYAAYEPVMQRYAMDKLLRGQASKVLMALYDRFLRPEMVDERLAECLASVLFVEEIEISNKKMRSVHIYYPELQTEIQSLLKNGRACLPIYTDKAILFFEDAYGYRYGNITFKRRRLMDREDLLQAAEEKKPDNRIYAYRRLLEIQDAPLANEAQLMQTVRFLKEEHLHEAYRKKLRKSCLDFVIRKQRFFGLDSMLLSVPRGDWTPEEEKQLIRLLIRSGYARLAYNRMKQLGRDFLEGGDRGELIDLLLDENPESTDAFLLELARHQMQENLWSDKLSLYLCKNLMATSDEMMPLLRHVRSRHLRESSLTESLFAMMLFTNSYDRLDEVYGYYSPFRPADDMMIQAYRTVKADLYLREKDRFPYYLFEEMLREIELDKPLKKIPSIHLYALLVRLAEKGELTEKEVKAAEKLLPFLLGSGKVHEAFYALLPYVNFPYESERMVFHTLFDYEGKHFRIEAETEDGEDLSAFAPAMIPEIYPGIYAFSLPLFPGEKARISITELGEDGSETRREEKVITAEHAIALKGTVVQTFSDAILCLHEGREEECYDRLMELERNRYITATLFAPQDNMPGEEAEIRGTF